MASNTHAQQSLTETMNRLRQSPMWPLAVAYNSFRFNVYQLRIQRGWTEKELARRMGIAQSNVARHACGMPPNLRSLARYATVFNVSIAELLDRQ